MINNKEEETFKSVLGKLVDDIEELSSKVDGIEKAQTEVDKSLKDYAEAKRTGTPVNFMRKETVEQTIKNIKLPAASIERETKFKIDNLVEVANDLCDKVTAIKPRRPLINITIASGKRYLWMGVGVAIISIIVMVMSRAHYDNLIREFQDQACYWGDRAYQAALLNDKEQPGEAYHMIMLHFTDEPEKSKKVVDILEKEAERYQEWKQYIFSFIGQKDSRDIRLLAWEVRHGEGWFLYRFYDEETERSIHIWADGRAEETTDKIVTDLASAQKYSHRNIWETVKEPDTESE